VQKAARAEMMADTVRSVLRRHFRPRLCGITSEAQRVQAQERGKIILRRGRDLWGKQYGRGKLQTESDKREQVTETRPLPAHSRRPCPHRLITPAGSICRSLIYLRVSLQSDQQPIL
jgi:hypothetical protein